MQYRNRFPVRLIALAILALVAVGCSETTNVGNTPEIDGGQFVRPEVSEECNGLDDNRDGRIDEGCPCAPGETQTCFSADYPSRGLGACRDGIQTCEAAPAVEWGDWGNSSCKGDVVPSAEICDGGDHDCDGLRDEGCPCTAGETVLCGTEFLIAPCTPGEQRCLPGGTWDTTCAGAIGPSAELCDNAVDDDCDGEVDDARLCDCSPRAEICDSGEDEDCDGDIDEPECSETCVALPEICGDGVDQDCDGSDLACPMPDGGTDDAGLPPPEGCTGFSDFRDRITWETAIPNAGHSVVSIGSDGQSAWLAGSGGDTVTLLVRPNLSGPYTFGSTSTREEAFGRLSFAAGEFLSLTPYAKRPTNADVTGMHIAVGGLFSGTVDLGPGPWTSDPTIYTSLTGPPTAVPDVYWAAGPESTSDFTRGHHYALSGIPADPMPDSFASWMQIDLTQVDLTGNTYFGGRFAGVLALGGGHSGESMPGRPITPEVASFIASFDASGAPRWIRALDGEQQPNGSVSPNGQYLVAIGFLQPTPHKPILQLLDGATGDTLFRHVGTSYSHHVGFDVDDDGNVYLTGTTGGEPLTFGGLSLPANTAYVMSFDRTGALRWSHQMYDNTFPAVRGGRFLVSVEGGEVAVLSSFTPGFGSPVEVTIGDCRAVFDKRWYPRSPETGVATTAQPSSNWEVDEIFIAVLDSGTGAHRWSRRMDSITGNLSMEMHPMGDVLFVMHNEPSFAQVKYSLGLMQNATHVFRLRGR